MAGEVTMAHESQNGVVADKEIIKEISFPGSSKKFVFAYKAQGSDMRKRHNSESRLHQ